MSLKDSAEEGLSAEMPLTVQLGPPEATLATMPAELLIEIMRLVLETGKKRHLSAFMRTNRRMLFLGMPFLVRELKFGENVLDSW